MIAHGPAAHDRAPAELPRDLEAEAALLGSMLLDGFRGEITAQVLNTVTEADLYLGRHQAIFDAITTLHARGGGVDMVRLNTLLRDRGQLEQVGGVEYLSDLTQAVPSATSAPHYAAIVLDKARRRRLVQYAEQLQRAALGGGDDTEALMDRAGAELAAMGGPGSEGATLGRPLGEDVAEVYGQLERWAEEGKRPEAGLRTGLPDLDHKLGGLRPGQMIVLAASTGAGKSALALQVAMEAAVRQAAPVGIFSLEMSRAQLAERALAYTSGVALDVVRGVREAKGDDFAAMASATGRLKDAPLYPVDQRRLTPERLRSAARWLTARHGVRLIVLDYLQLMQGSRRESRNVEVGELSRAVKLLALELEVPVLCLSQFNRDSSRDNRRPRLCDLRDSGSIEQDADAVLLLHDPSRQAEPPAEGYEPDEKDLELIVAKQRQGPTGSVRLRFDGARQTFRNIQMVGGIEL